MYQLPTAPLSIGGILDDGFRLFRASWKTLLPIAIVASVLGVLPQVMLSGLAELEPGKPPDPAMIGAGAIVSFVAIVLLYIVSWAIVLAGVDLAAKTGGASLGSVLAAGVRRFPAMLGTGLLVSLAIAVGLVLLVIPGLYLMVALYPAAVLPVAERLGPWGSIRRARELVRGVWWRTALVLTVLTILIVALLAIASVLSGLSAVPFIDEQDPAAAVDTLIVIQLVVAVVLAPLMPLPYCFMYSVYSDLRLRKDGSDLLERVGAAGN